MGNANSTQAAPDASPKDALAPTRRAPKRRESIGGLSSKGAALPPTASLESATAQPSQSRSSGSQSRGRSQTQPVIQTASSDALDDTGTPNRSRSPQPPLNVDTSIPAPPDLEPLARTTSSGLSGPSDSPVPIYAPFSQFGRPPRLPLPIEEEPHAPGSPAPGSPLLLATGNLDDDVIDQESLDRTRSVLSATTMDDDEDDEDAFYRADEVQGPLVDTLLEWKEGGEKVYVTGTFCGWAKKSRLHKNGPSKDPNAFSAIIGLPPGALYLSFLVDGEAKTARHMPTTVDWTNALVNYLHVPPEDTPQPVIPGDASKSGPAEPTTGQEQPVQQSTDPIPPTPEVRPATAAEVHAAPPSTLPTRAMSKKHKTTPAITTDPEARKQPPPGKKKKPDEKVYHSEIPAYLLDWDAPEDSSRVRRANAVSDTHQPPPQLPPYLQKSILSSATPMKDDASVLNFPNHTVLNHLATSSIKDGVLGTSATTRYKKKFVTTIMYMPTGSN